MNRKSTMTIGIAVAMWLAVFGGFAVSAQDKYTVKVPGGLGTTAGTPPQGNDAKCGFACHTKAKARDYVFTEYGKR